MKRYTVVLDADALRDLASIRDHVTAERGRLLADKFADRIFQHLSKFASMPRRGALRSDIRPGLRIAGWRRTLNIAFRVDEAAETVVILAVLYRGRDVESVLRERNV